MISNGRDPPTFSADSSSAPGASLLSTPPLHARTRTVTRDNFTHGLSNSALDESKYYVPTTTNNPFIDSFTIDPDLDRHTVVISVFQIATSSTNGGSAEGCPLIHKIMARVRELLESEGLNATVEVAYFLVCPDDGSEHQWQMPVGWGNGAGFNGLRRGVFCIRVPVSVSKGG